MSLVKSLLILVITAGFFSCSSGSSSGEKVPRGKQSGNVARNCIPEAELLAGGIIGGSLVKPTDEDSKTVMMVISNGELCTGSAISDNVILTAAHCVVSGKRENTFVAFYPSLSCESGFSPAKHAMGVSKIVVHEDYDPKVEADVTSADIALVFLDGKVPAGYPIYKIASPENAIEDALVMYGYGRTGSNSGGAGMLRKTIIQSADYKIDRPTKKINVRQSNGVGICQGDSGGPSLILVKGELEILGINSYVVGSKNDICNNSSFETLVSEYTGWISQKMSATGSDPVTVPR